MKSQTSKNQLIIHTGLAMQTAWKMYESLEFKRSDDFECMQGELPDLVLDSCYKLIKTG